MPIRLFIADDHIIFRDGLRAFVVQSGEDIQVVGEASDGLELLEWVSKNVADVYIVDISMPKLSGPEAVQRLIDLRPGSKVLMLSMYEDKPLVERSFKSGACGYITKESPGEEIIRAVKEVFHGRYYLSPSIAGFMVEGFLNTNSYQEKEKQESSLTIRQREVLKLICDGLTEKEIASLLNISTHTVHVHKNNIMSRLGIHTKAGLIKFALRTGISQIT
jgi:two-component system NarL family response regulator